MYYAKIAVKPSGLSGTIPWVVRNAGVKTVRITRIGGAAVFSGATSAGGLMGFEFVRATLSALADGAAATVAVGKLNGSHATAGLAGLFLAAGVTVTATPDTAGPLTVLVPQVEGGVVPFEFPGLGATPFSGAPPGGTMLLVPPGSGVMLRMIEDSKAGLGIAGSVEWTEV